MKTIRTTWSILTLLGLLVIFYVYTTEHHNGHIILWLFWGSVGVIGLSALFFALRGLRISSLKRSKFYEIIRDLERDIFDPNQHINKEARQECIKEGLKDLRGHIDANMYKDIEGEYDNGNIP